MKVDNCYDCTILCFSALQYCYISCSCVHFFEPFLSFSAFFFFFKRLFFICSERYNYTNENGEAEVTCIARGQPRSFNKNDVIIKVSSDKEATLTYLPHEELISNVVDLKSTNGNEELKVRRPDLDLMLRS